MNRFFTLFISVFISVGCSAQAWLNSPVVHQRHIYALEIIDREHVISAGGSESNDSLQDIFKSTSGGLVWDFSSNQGSGYIRSVDFIDSANGLAVGYAGKIMRTTNGATSWDQIYGPFPISQRNFTSVNYLSTQTVVAVGGRNYTNDTIQTVIKSTDGGSTWNIVRDITGRWLKGAYFINSTTGFAVGSAGTIIKTIDAGNTWTPVSSPINNRDFNAVYFNNATTGYIVGGNYVEYDTLNSVRTILKTTDGGDTWNIIIDEPGAWLTAIDFIDEYIGYLVGDGAQFYKTTNGGSNWTRQEVTGAEWYYNFTSVKFLSEDYGLVGCRFGAIFLYANDPLPEVFTMPAYIAEVTDTNARVLLNAEINTNGLPSTYNFKYSTSLDFTTDVGLAFLPFYPAIPFNSNVLAPANATVSNLLRDTTYYYFAIVTTAGGIVNGDTLSFSTSPFYTELTTLPATFVNENSVVLNGRVDGFTTPVALSFERGNGPEVQASPAVVSDNLQHSVSGSVDNLISGYYSYRLKGVTAAATVYGEYVSFLIGPAYQTLQTLPATNIELNSATLNGYITGLSLPAQLSFEYGNTISLGSELVATPASINDSYPYNISLQLSGLGANTPVYYRLKVETNVGTFYGEILSFITGMGDMVFETSYATNVASTSSRVNAVVDNMDVQANLFFEYGTTPAMGNTIPANEPVLNDTLYHQVYAGITGLQPATRYYYRLRADFSGNFDLLSPVRQFYTAEPEIPNWDLQDWENDSSTIPMAWNMPTKNFEQVAGVTGHALRIYGLNIALMGLVQAGTNDDMDFYNGCPMNSRPDSIIFNLNYTIAPSDSAIIYLRFTNQNNPVADNFYIVTGNSGGNYSRLAFPISYQSPLMPDTFNMIIAPLVIFADALPNPANSLSIDDISFSPPLSPVCNGDFEDWFSFQHFDLQDWSYPKHAAIDTANVAASRIVRQSVFDQPADYAAEIHNIPAFGHWLTGGIASLKDNFTFKSEAPSFPVPHRHQSFNGYFKYFPENNDTAVFLVTLYKNGELVGQGSMFVSDTVSEYQQLDIPLVYINDSIIPDSADIVITAAKEPPQGPSVLFIDKIGFDGFWAGVDDTTGIRTYSANEQLLLFPNPAKDYVVAELKGMPTAAKFLVQVLDINGRILVQDFFPSSQSRIIVDVSEFNAGLYFVKIVAGERVHNNKIVVVK